MGLEASQRDEARSVAAVFAAAGAGFVNTNARELGQQWLEFLPDPLGEVFAGGVVEAGQIVQVIVIETLVERLEDGLDLGEVANPAGLWIDIAFDINGDAERVAMQASALVPGRYVGEAVCRFEGEFFEQFQGVALCKS